MPITPEEIQELVRAAQTSAREKSAEMNAEGEEKSKIYHAYSLTGVYEEVNSCLAHLEAERAARENLDPQIVKEYVSKAIQSLAMSYVFAVEMVRSVAVTLSAPDEARYSQKLRQAEALAATLCYSEHEIDQNLLIKLYSYSGRPLSNEDWLSAIKTVLPDETVLDNSFKRQAALLLSQLPRPVVESLEFFEMFDPPGADMQGYVDVMNECKSGVGLKDDFPPDVRSFHLHISVYPDAVEMTFNKNTSGVICHQVDIKFTDLPTRDLKDYFHYHAAQETPGLALHKRVALDQERKTLHLRLAVHAKVTLEKQGIIFTGAAAADFTGNLVSMFLDVRQKWLDRQIGAQPAPGRGGGPA